MFSHTIYGLVMADRQPSASRGNYVLNLIGSQAVIAPSTRSHNRPVTITPLSAVQQQSLVSRVSSHSGKSDGASLGATPQRASQCVQPQKNPVPVNITGSFVIKKILLKAFIKGKKDSKVFTLRNIRTDDVTSCKDLVSIIKSQLQHDVIKDFDVGFVENSSSVSIRSNEDLRDVWDQIKRGKNTMLWCDGMAPMNKRRIDAESDEEHNSRRSKKKKQDDTREDRVEEMVKTLKAKHGNSAYTQMQYRAWAEMIAGGVHRSENDPLTTTMFSRCGSGGGSVRKRSSDIVQVMEKLSDVLSPHLLMLIGYLPIVLIK